VAEALLSQNIRLAFRPSGLMMIDAAALYRPIVKTPFGKVRLRANWYRIVSRPYLRNGQAYAYGTVIVCLPSVRHGRAWI